MKNTYVSSDTTIATVDSNGVVTGIRPGRVRISGYDQQGNYLGYSEWEVTPSSSAVPTTGITLNASEITLYYAYNDTATLVPTVYPDNATDKNIVWSVSPNTDAVTCVNGVVKCNKKGTGTFTVTATIGEHSAQCTVNIANNGTVINRLSPSVISMNPDEAGQDRSYLITVNSNNLGGYNSGYTITVDERYATISDKRDSSFVLNVKKNTGNTRTFTVTVQGNDSGSTAKTVTVTQPSANAIDDGTYMVSIASGTTNINDLTWYWNNRATRLREPGSMEDPWQEQRDAGDTLCIFGVKPGYKTVFAVDEDDLQKNIYYKVNSLTPLTSLSVRLDAGSGTYKSEMSGNNITVVPYYLPSQKQFRACLSLRVECPSGIAIAVPDNFEVSTISSPTLYDVYQPYPNNMRDVDIYINVGDSLPSVALLGKIRIYRITPNIRRIESINDAATGTEIKEFNVYSNRIKD